jgi:thioredoxin 1
MNIKAFESLIQTRDVLLIDFYADWCEPCNLLAEILEEVQIKMGEKIFIQKINVDISKEVSEYYHVKSVPVLMLFKNGELLWRMNGFLMSNELIKKIKSFISS